MVELGVECERIEVAYKTEMKSPEYLKLNPFGKVPVLVDGDVVIYELGAICAYLADKFSDKGLAPALNDPKRGLYYRWLFVMAGPWEAAGVDKALGIEVSPEQKMFVGYGDYNDAYQALVQGLSEANPYVCGEQFTAADVSVGAMLLWQLKMNAIESHPAIVSVGAMLLWQLKMNAIESHPAITRYVETIKQREGLKQSTMGQLL